MAFYGKDVFTAIEFGTGKICALHGACDKAGNPEILGFAQHPSEGAVIKGTIVDYNAALRILNHVLEDADKSASCDFDRKNVYYLMSGASVTSQQGEGNVLIYDEDHKIKDDHINEAIKKAQSLSLSPELVNFNSFDSYFMINTNHRVKNPCGQIADRLDAFVHIISVERKRIETIRSLLGELGFEKGGDPVFSGIASAYGALNSDEREHGTLLVDFGAGVCDYVAVHNEGVLLSGVLPVGTDNIANDLAIGLDLNIDVCRKFLRESKLDELRHQGQNFVEIPGISVEKTRRIPLGSFEKIIDMRLRETFSIIKEQLDSRNLSPLLGAGCVLCGGGAMLRPSVETMREVMGMYVRMGEAVGITGAMSGLDKPPCCYTALMGLLKYAVEVDSGNGAKGLNRVGDALEGFTDGIVKGFKNITRAFKL